MLHGIFLAFFRKCPFEWYYIVHTGAKKAVYKHSELWQISVFAQVNKDLMLAQVIASRVKQPDHQKFKTILDVGYCVSVKKQRSERITHDGAPQIVSFQCELKNNSFLELNIVIIFLLPLLGFQQQGQRGHKSDSISLVTSTAPLAWDSTTGVLLIKIVTQAFIQMFKYSPQHHYHQVLSFQAQTLLLTTD